MTLHSDSLPSVPKASRQGPSKSTQLLSASIIILQYMQKRGGSGRNEQTLADADLMLIFPSFRT